MRKRLMVLLMAVMMVVMSAAPAIADQRIRRPLPVSSPGLQQGHGEEHRPEQAADPTAGPLNRFCHGSPQNGTECL